MMFDQQDDELQVLDANEASSRNSNMQHRQSRERSQQRVAGDNGPPRRRQPDVGWLDLPNKDQLFILAMCRLSEPLSSVCLLPYIFYLVRSALAREPPSPGTDNGTGSSTDSSGDHAAKISAYSGLLVASFPLAQFAVSLPWGRLSDAHGRKLSIVTGLLISGVANAAFGFSRSFGALIFWRTLSGLANGNVGIMRTMTAEIVKEPRFLTRAFLLLPLVFNSGMVASLVLGGMLADPVVNLAWLFGPDGLLNLSHDSRGVQWLAEQPYALPALMNASLLAFALILAILWLRETLPGKEDARDVGLLTGLAISRCIRRNILRRQDQPYMSLNMDEDGLLDSRQGRHQTQSLVELEEMKEARDTVAVLEIPSPTRSAAVAVAEAEKQPLRSVFNWRTMAALVSFGLLPLHNSAFMHILPVYLSTPHNDARNDHVNLISFTGGLGLQSSTIGIWLSLFGICGILAQLWIYPIMQARLGTLGVFKVSLFIFPLVYLLAPYLSLLPETGHLSAVRWIGLGFVIGGQILARTMAIPSTVILLTESAPSRAVLGTVHGAGNMLASLARAVGPAAGGTIYAAGITEGVVGTVWWFYLVVVCIAAGAWCFGVQGPKEKELNE